MFAGSEDAFIIRVMKRSLLTLLIMMLLSNFAAGQPRKFRWTNEMCEFEGTYNASRYSESRLRNTLKLIGPGGFGISTEATAWKYEDIDLLSASMLEREYLARSAELRSLAIVNTAFFEKLRREKLRELEKVYLLSKITIRGYREPASLLEYRDAGECVKLFGIPLNDGGELLLQTWRRVNEDSRSKNADPERLRRIYDEQFASPDRLKFARVEVMMFGWWNCANARIPYVAEDGRAEREFKKLFIRVRTIDCDEP